MEDIAASMLRFVEDVKAAVSEFELVGIALEDGSFPAWYYR